ncbi:DMT family transporter [Nonomuraea gerenzanensis]|uniref:Permease of the drug/metabolite transporter (DMT) superfamily n=1 Tax=Nonomuraea gerenzanensis TaxID=93944 RepID=A0A1M4EAH3_9ACTN|nr:DMT family transporter [Nonomuraea gerenzanensis]UBU18006.1 DMT family transporter [Nonomuraea gerenzanensis]SBO95810.1 Permease of the drug/metabolite transporter (DMT) superfamily [Nonomuraea gerenzanensis]
MSRRGWVLFALISVMWGIPYLLIKVAVSEVPVPVLVFARTAIGAALLLPLALRGGQLGQVRRHWRPVAAFAFLEILAPWWLLSDAERQLSSSTAGLLIAAAPILGVLLARMTGGEERLGRARWAGLALGVVGTAVLAGPHLEGGDAWSITEVLLTVLAYALAPLIADRYLRDVPTIPLTAACLAFAALVYAPAAAWTWPSVMPSGAVLAALLGLGVLCTGLAFVVYVELIREAGPSRALVSTYVNPAVAIAAGVLVLQEPLTGLIAVSFVLILAGSVLATRAEGEPPSSAERPAELEDVRT